MQKVKEHYNTYWKEETYVERRLQCMLHKGKQCWGCNVEFFKGFWMANDCVMHLWDHEGYEGWHGVIFPYNTLAHPWADLLPHDVWYFIWHDVIFHRHHSFLTQHHLNLEWHWINVPSKQSLKNLSPNLAERNKSFYSKIYNISFDSTHVP